METMHTDVLSLSIQVDKKLLMVLMDRTLTDLLPNPEVLQD